VWLTNGVYNAGQHFGKEQAAAKAGEFILSVENNLTHICVVPLPGTSPGVDNCFADPQIPRKTR